MSDESTQEVAVEETEVQETTETTEQATETQETEVQEPELTLPPPKKQTAQERINELTRKRREAEREAERLREELKEKSQTQPTQYTDRPKLENFQTTEQYEDALLDWKLDQLRKEEDQKRRAIDEEQALSKFNQQAKKLREIYEDFDEVVEQPVFSPVMRDTILRSEDGAMVSYFLGRPENAETADRIRRLSPREQIYELGKLETKIKLAQTTKKTTAAPDPIKPVGITGGSVIDESKLSDDEWFKREQEREKEKIRKKYGG